MDKEMKKRCLGNVSQCNHLVRRSKFTITNKNISWWDSQIQLEIDSMKSRNDLTYKELVMKRRMEKRNYHQSLTSLTLERAHSSVQRIPYSNSFYPDDLVSTLKKFIETPKQNARIWRAKSRTYHPNAIDSYDKMENEMKSSFLNYCNANIEGDNKHMQEVLDNLFSTEVDPLSLSSAVKISSKLRKVVPDITIKNVGKPKMLKNEMITRLIHRDIKSLKRKKRTVAFGSTIRKPVCKVDKYDFKTKYVNIGHFHEELETFKSVWEGILDLETTRRFCAWLTQHENIHPPRYLVQKGGLKRRFKSLDKSQELLLAQFEGYDVDIKESSQLYDMLSKYKSSLNDSSFDSLTDTTSSLPSLDISDINIII